MRTDNIEVKLTFSIPFGKPNLNGVVYTEEAIRRASYNLNQKLPITYMDNEENSKGKLIGTTTESYSTYWDYDNQVCRITKDGVIFYGGTQCIVNAMENGNVTDFEIVGIGLSK